MIEELIIKMVLLGDEGSIIYHLCVGKTSIIKTFVDEIFDQNEKSTNGAVCKVKTIFNDGYKTTYAVIYIC